MGGNASMWRRCLVGLSTAAVAATLLAGPAAAETAHANPAGNLIAGVKTWDDAGNGPALTVPAADLAASLSCHGDLAKRTPVLLVPGTAVTPAEFSWNYMRAFTATGRPFCAVTVPQNSLADIQVSAEYIVSAIRTMSAKAKDHKIDVLGHSQGGMSPRWALKYWPDTRKKVDDFVALAPSNHGTVVANGVCASPTGCAPGIWQQRADARFIAVLNAGRETYDDLDYSVAYTNFDEVVFPNLDLPRVPGLPDAAPAASSPLRGGGKNVSNAAVQAICPGHVADHLTIGTSDPVAYAFAIDAFDHPGPAQPARIDRSVCLQPFQPGVNPATFPTDFAGLVTSIGVNIAGGPMVPAEPALRAYATRGQ